MKTINSYSSDSFVIEGGRELKGSVRVSGSKNASLPVILATILVKGESVIEDVPELLDVWTAVEILESLGGYVERENGRFKVNTEKISRWDVPEEIVKKMRASILCMGPLLARFGKVLIPKPGGCSIGKRPIDQHLKFFERAGGSIKEVNGFFQIEIKKKKPVEFRFDLITVTGTENALLYLSSVRGKSILKNIAIEPEVMDLINVLNKMGARIYVEGRTAEIEGNEDLKPFTHRVIPDRIEAGTLMVGAVMTSGDVILENVNVEHIGNILEKLEEAGGGVEILSKNKIRVFRKEELKPVNIETAEYPGFPTDMQAQFMSMASISKGISRIKENIFENRFHHVWELRKMGADIEVKGREAIVRGVRELRGAEVKSTDLRASASLILAGLVARGKTIIRDIYHLDRGYERLEEKLGKLGALIERLPVCVS